MAKEKEPKKKTEKKPEEKKRNFLAPSTWRKKTYKGVK